MAEVVIFGECRERQSREGGKGSEHGARTFYFGDSWEWWFRIVSSSVVLQDDVVLDCGATDTAGGVEAVQITVDVLTPGFPQSLVEVDSLDRPWFRFANGHWCRALSRVWLLTPLSWTSMYTLDAEDVPVLAGMNLLENHDTSFGRNEFLVYDAEGNQRSVPLRRSPSGRRMMNLLSWGQRTASCFSRATAL